MKSRFFRFMSAHVYAFMLFLPCVWIVLTAVGWSRDDIVEEDVTNIWVPTSGSFSDDKKYRDSIIGDDYNELSAFLAMSKSRDGENLFTEERLKEIRQRMEDSEKTTIDYKGETYTMGDVCAGNNAGPNTAYEFPCLRVSAMDLFEESGYSFDEQSSVTWYDELITKRLVNPRITRFGIMSGVCSTLGGGEVDVCNEQLSLRQSAPYAVSKGFPEDYADPLLLFDDIGSMEMNNPCKICIEQGIEQTIAGLTRGFKGVFGAMLQELSKVPTPRSTETEELLAKVQKIFVKINSATAEEFYKYYVIRSLYSQLGATSYQENYALILGGLGEVCSNVTGAPCPTNVTSAEARAALTTHADNTFSSINTAGFPFPFSDKGDGTGYLFNGNEPIGGSGIDMSGTLLSSTAYFDLNNYGTPNWSPLYSGGQNGTVDVNSAAFQGYVMTDPVFKWFIAGETEFTGHCGNENLPGTESVNAAQTAGFMATVSSQWCTKYNVPFQDDETYTKTHFAKMFYDLLIASEQFLGITKGKSNPYTWTSGNGCDYSLGGSRDPYTNVTTEDILTHASRELYFLDEGVAIGAVDRSLLIGGASPAIGEYNFSNPLKEVTVIQTIYVSITSEQIVDRVKNCNRPNGALNITVKDANEILLRYKRAFESAWSAGWDNGDDGEIQFVGYYDSVGVSGTTDWLLDDITLANGKLMAISIIIIAVISAIFLFSTDVVESRVLLTLVGVGLVLISFFGALGFGLILGIKININIAWTLPFIILGLGVDDMYIVLISIKERKGYTQRDFITAMKEVITPVTMTSLVNGAMFAIMNMVNIPAVYKTAQMALISVIFLYLTIVFCFPAWCYFDMKRQAAGRLDVFCCFKKDTNPEKETSARQADKDTETLLYQYIYKPLVFGEGKIRWLTHAIILLGGISIFATGIYGLTQREVGLGLEDFFPETHQAGTWAKTRTSEMASWSISVNWGALDYTNPNAQMKMIKQFEDVVANPYVAELDTKYLWMASFLIWTTTHCTTNFDRDNVDELECGADQIFTDDNNFTSSCSGIWTENIFDLREKFIEDPKSETCNAYEGGICRSAKDMHPADLYLTTGSFCPVIDGWSNDKLSFCLTQWRLYTGGGGSLTMADNATPNPTCAGEVAKDSTIDTPILYSRSSTMYGLHLNTHKDTVAMLEGTRRVCDEDPTSRCWMNGIPFDFWEQYIYVDETLFAVGGASVAVGFIVSAIFLFTQLKNEHQHETCKILAGSIAGAALIALTTAVCLVPVVGLSVLSNVSFTAFSNMSFVLSVAFAVEHSVHVVHRFLEAPKGIKAASARVEYAMSFLFLPLTLSFISSAVGVICLAFTEFRFNEVYFFRPLIIVMAVTYFFGVWFLPVLLTYMNFEVLNFGKGTRASVFYNDEDIKDMDIEDPEEIEEIDSTIDSKKVEVEAE